jgi:hypothetical protein
MVGEIHPVIWVTVNLERKYLLERAFEKALQSFELKQCQLLPKVIPTMYSFVEGSEVLFLKGSNPVDP